MNTSTRTVCLLLGLACTTVYGAVPERFQIASKPIETPHVKWASPLGGGPLRVLCLVPIPSQRDVVELAQRLDMQYDLVAYEHPLMDKDAAAEFQKRLAGRPYDVILLSKVPLAKLPAQTQALLVDKVRQGAGVLSVHAASTLKTGEVINVAQSAPFLEAGLPLCDLPEGCRPEVKVGRCGQGRCVNVSYAGRVTCLTPEVKFEQVDYGDWETYFQLLARAVLWAAGREPGVQIELVWPTRRVDRRVTGPWRTEEVVRTAEPCLARQSGTWKVAWTEERLPLSTWTGYGATVAEQNGKLKITEANARGSRGFAAGVFRVDLHKTPILEISVDRAAAWSLFVPDGHFERTLATLQPQTDQTGTKRYDLREVKGIGDGEPVTLCFATIGEKTSLVLGSLEFVDAEGKLPAAGPQPLEIPKSAGVALRLRSPSDTTVVVTATYRGLDYYEPIEQRRQQVTLPKDKPVDVTFPLLDMRGGPRHRVDLVVRDAQGRSLGYATASYPVVSPVTLASWAADKEFYRRGEEAVLVAKLHNQSAPRDAQLEASLSDMHGRLIARVNQKIGIPAGQSEQKVSLATGNSLTTLNCARLRLSDAKGLLLERRAYVYVPEASPAWDDYLVSTSQFSNRNAYLRPYYTQLARDIGIEGMVIPLSYSFEVLKQGAPVMYWGAAKVRAFGYNFHGEETSTARRPCLSDPATRSKISAAYEELGAALRRYGPLAIASLEDESELSGARYSNLEVCTSEYCTGRYRRWLKEQYGTVESLNAEWGTDHKSFDRIEPMTYQQARKAENPAPWVDWRTFMEHVWLDALLLTRKGVKKRYPEVRMGFSNSFGEMPFSGWNYETLSPHVDMTIEYPTIIDRITPPKKAGAFEEDALPMNIAIRQKLDIRKSFMRGGCPAPGWIWYDRSQQGAEFKPWWMAFLGARGCTPWGPASLGVRPGAKHMAFWAFLHPLLAQTKSSEWLASGIHDLVHGVGKIFVDYQKAPPRVAVLYSQPSMHLAWAWSDTERAFYPETTSLYAWYYKSRVNVTRLLRELGFSYRYVGTSQIDSGELADCRVLFLPCSLCLSDETLKHVHEFAKRGGLVVADVGAGAADEHGKPVPRRKLVEGLFGVSRQAVGRKVEPNALTGTGRGNVQVPKGLGLAGSDAIAANADFAALHPDKTPAIVVNRIGKGQAIYLNGLIGYNMPSRLLVRQLLASAGVSTPLRITSGGSEHLGYECATFRRGDVEVLGILRLRDEQGPTQINLGEAKHVYDVRAGKYLGRTDVARLDLTEKAAAVLALMPYQVTGVDVRVTPGQCTPGQPVTIQATVRSSQGNPGDHMLRMEVHGPSGALSRAYTANVLAAAGRFDRALRTALNDPPGRWRVVVTDVISGRKSEAAFELGGEK